MNTILGSRSRLVSGTLHARNGPSRLGSGTAWFTIKNQSGSDPVEILIYDQIGKDWWSGEGIEAKEFASQLQSIPKDREIVLRINSPGGNVHDGMAIYSLMAERRDKVECVVDGVAASIASVIAMCGRSLKMPRNALLMIHDPWGVVQGSADDMRQAAEMLDKHRDAIVTVYERKTGEDPEEIKKWMKAETWYTGDEAKTCKFCDEVTNEISFQASFDFSSFQNVPDRLKAQLSGASNSKLSAASSGENHKQGEKEMNREKLIAALKKRGITVADTATDDEVLAAWEKALADASQQQPPVNNQAPPVADKPDTKVSDEMRKELDAIKAKFEQERKQRIEQTVEACIAEDKIPANQRAKWVTRALADESVLEDLKAMPAKPPGAEALHIAITSEDPRDIQTGILNLRKPLNGWLHGNSVDVREITNHAKKIAVEIDRNRKKLQSFLGDVMNANTIDSNLKRTVILDDLMRAFKRRLLMLNVFSTTFNNVPLEGTDKVTVPYYELDTTASVDWVAATGYTFAGDTSVSSRTITINKRKFQSMNFSSDTFRRQPYFNAPQSLQMKVEQLAVDVWTDILSLVTATNYGVTAFDGEAAAFDSDDLIDLMKKADDADWPDIGRACVLGTAHKAALLKDDDLKSALHSGSDQALRQGATGRLFNFDMFFSPRIPANSENLAGFICMPQAALVATAPIAPAPGVRNRLLSYELVVDPDTGIAFEYRYWDDADKDTDREVVECSYGYVKGNGDALKRITDGAAEYSSSSSASSVNSSSSSSSSPSF